MKKLEVVGGKSFKRKVAGIAAMSLVMSLLLQLIGLIPVMLMPTVIDAYIPNGQIKEVGKLFNKLCVFKARTNRLLKSLRLPAVIRKRWGMKLVQHCLIISD